MNKTERITYAFNMRAPGVAITLKLCLELTSSMLMNCCQLETVNEGNL